MIPAVGLVVVVANHPFGVLDGAILTVLLTRARPDVKVITKSLLGDIPELERHCIFVNPFHTDRSAEVNRRALRKGAELAEASRHAGSFSRWRRFPLTASSGPDRRPTLEPRRLPIDKRTSACAVPIYFCGHNSLGFQVMGMIHPVLRTTFLLQEFLQQKGKTVEVRIRSSVSGNIIAGIDSDQEAT